jgi:hypothetical protein
MQACFAASPSQELATTRGDSSQKSLHLRGALEESGRVDTFLLSPAASYLTGALWLLQAMHPRPLGACARNRIATPHPDLPPTLWNSDLRRHVAPH